MRAVCLKHVPFEGPGAFATALTERGVSLERISSHKTDCPKDAGDLLIVMGGPMSVNDPDPWIAEETEFIRSATPGRQARHWGVSWKSVHGEGVGRHRTSG